MKTRYYKIKNTGEIAVLHKPPASGVAILEYPDGTEKKMTATNVKLIADPVQLEPDVPRPSEPPAVYSYFLDYLNYSANKGKIKKTRSMEAFVNSLPDPKPSYGAFHKWARRWDWIERANTFDFAILEEKRKTIKSRSGSRYCLERKEKRDEMETHPTRQARHTRHLRASHQCPVRCRQILRRRILASKRQWLYQRAKGRSYVVSATPAIWQRGTRTQPVARVADLSIREVRPLTG